MGWGRTNNVKGDSGDKKEGGAYKNILQRVALPAINIRKSFENEHKKKNVKKTM